MSHWEEQFFFSLEKLYGFHAVVRKIKSGVAHVHEVPKGEYPKWKHYNSWIEQGIDVEKIPLSQFMFDERPKGERKQWRFDCCFPSIKLAIEIHGGTSMGQKWKKGKEPLGAHNTADGMKNDCEKVCFATIQGWSVMQVTDAHVRSGEAVKWFADAARRRFALQ